MMKFAPGRREARSTDDLTMNAASPAHTSYEDDLVAEVPSEMKHEWCDGVVYAMSRGTPEHGRLTLAIGAALLAALRGRCTGFGPDTMLFVELAKLSTHASIAKPRLAAEAVAWLTARAIRSIFCAKR
jgi:Uma2 family endonuclease